MSDSRRLPTLVVGLGPIGRRACRYAARSPRLEVVGAVDVDPDLVGRDPGELAETDPLGLAVEADLEAALERGRPALALLCTASSLPAIAPDLERLAGAGVNVVTPCEEMLLPEFAHPELARRLHDAARAGGATLLGIGVNPGFVLDLLPVVLSGVCWRVRRVKARRVLDAAARRLPLQRKVGAGLTEARFHELAQAGRLGHVGMRESVALIGRALELELDSVTQTVEPVLADRDLQSGVGAIPSGAVAGIRNRGLGHRAGKLVVDLDLQMYVGAREPYDRIEIDGDPPVRMTLEGGVPGDQATAALLVNAGPRVVAAPPGLATVLEIAPPRSCA